MTLRKLLYWPHLFCGVLAALVIFLMSVTGVILTYERQVIAWAEGSYAVPPPGHAPALPLDALLERIPLQENASRPATVKRYQDSAAPVVIRDQNGYSYLDPYSGTMIGHGPVALRAFFKEVTLLHRWLSLEGEDREIGRMITGISNLVFLFILVSGIYLWFPRVLKWQAFKKILFFQKNKNAKVRDFNWHNVMGIWFVIPLIIIAATAVVFNYGWANNLVYILAGDTPPAKSRSRESEPAVDRLPPPAVSRLSFQQLWATAASHQPGWQSITMTLPRPGEPGVRFWIDRGNGGEPQKTGELVLDRQTGERISWVSFADRSPGRQARFFIRFLHTGEALGIIGQTIAGLASLATLFMIWTGLALAYRRYLRPRKSRESRKKGTSPSW